MTAMRANKGAGETDAALGELKQRKIALVGLMGAGKSSIGRRLAARLDMPFKDSDREIELASGTTVADLFEQFGEAEFRAGERRVISRLLSGGPLVLATGGGAFAEPETRKLIATRTITVWLDVEIETLVARVSRRSTRPLLRNADPRAVLEELARTRGPAYAQADLRVRSGDGSHNAVVDNILTELEKFVGDGRDGGTN